MRPTSGRISRVFIDPFRHDRPVFRRGLSRIFHALGLLIVCLALFASNAARAEDDEISIGYQPIVNGPLWIARHEGYFEKLGLRVNFIKFTSGPAQFAALAGGRINLAWGGISAFMLARANGANIVWIASVEDYNPLEGLVIPKDSPVTSVKQLAGKKVGLVFGSDADYGMHRALQLAGMQLNEVQLLNMAPPQQVAALLNGDIDAAFFWSPFVNQVLDRGGKIIFSNGSLPDGPGFLGWAGQKDWLDAHKSALVKLFRGWDMGYRKMLESPELAAKYSVEYVGISKDTADAMQSKLGYFEAAAMLDAKSRVYFAPGSNVDQMLNRSLAFAIERQLVKGKVKPEEYVDTAFLQAYLKAYPEKH